MSTKNGEAQVAVLLPESLVERIGAQWRTMHRDPAVAAISPRYTRTGAVRVALHLALKQLEKPEAVRAQPVEG